MERRGSPVKDVRLHGEGTLGAGMAEVVALKAYVRSPLERRLRSPTKRGIGESFGSILGTNSPLHAAARVALAACLGFASPSTGRAGYVPREPTLFCV